MKAIKSFFARMVTIILASAAAGVLSSAAQAAPNLVTNGSFETPTQPPGNYQLYNPGDTGLTGWTITAQIAQDTSFFNCCGYTSLTAADGSEWLDMTGNNDNGTGGISQNIATIIGHTYQLSLQVGNANAIGQTGATSTINVGITGTTGFSDSNSNASNSLMWQSFTHSFIATSTTTTLSFTNGDHSGDNLNGLDNISVMDLGAVSGVPETATWIMMMIGVGFVGASLRRRQVSSRRAALA